MWSNKWLKSSTKSRKTMQTASMREKFLVLNLSEEMNNSLCFTRKSKFFKVHWQEVKSSIRNVLEIFVFLNSKLEITSKSSELWNLKLLRFLIWEKKFTISSSSSFKSGFKWRPYPRSSRTPWTSTDGVNLVAQIQTPGKCCRKSRPCRRGWSRKPRK